MHFSGSKTANCLQQRLARNPVHSPPALRALDLQFYPHTTLLPHKKPVPTCVNTDLTCMLCGAPNLHALTCMLCGARNPARRGSDLLARSRILAALPDLRALHPRARDSHPRLHACRASPHPLPALTRSARHRPWRHVQRTAAPARGHSRQRPEPRGRCAHPHQDGFHRRSEALQ